MTSINGAAHAALTPLRFLERAGAVFPERVGIVDGPRRITYREFVAEANRLANALAASGVEPGARVAYLCPNSAPMLIAARSTMGVGGAAIMPATLSILTNVFTNPSERAKAIGVCPR